MRTSIVSALLLIVAVANSVWADFGGPTFADNAASPDGNLVVRIVRDESKRAAGELPSHSVRLYEFDPEKDSY
jgi:hypothetical protein